MDKRTMSGNKEATTGGGVAESEGPSSSGPERLSNKPSSKVGLDGFNRHVHSILDKVLDSPLPTSSGNLSVSDPAVAAALSGDRQDGPPDLSSVVTEMEAEGHNPSLHYCKLCQVWISGELNCQAHLSGRKHIKRARLYQQMQLKASGGSATSRRDGDDDVAESPATKLEALGNGPKVCLSVLMPVSEADTSMVPLYKCNLCDITATSLDHLEAHYRGVKHQKRLALEAMKTGGEASAIMTETLEGKPICPGAAFHCSVCDITCSSLENLQTHCKGRKHIRRLTQSKQRSSADPKAGEDPMSSAMAAASASLAAMSIGRHHQQQQQQLESLSRRSSEGTGVPYGMPVDVMPSPMYMPHHLPPPPPPHQMMGMPPQVLSPEQYGYHHPHHHHPPIHQMPPHPSVAYMPPSAAGPWPSPSHLVPPHHHHHHPPTAYMGWVGQPAMVPPPPPRQQHQPHYCVVVEEATSVAEEAQAGEEEEIPTKVGDVSSGSIHSSTGTMVELSSSQQAGEANTSIFMASGEASDEDDDELCLSSGRSTPVAYGPEARTAARGVVVGSSTAGYAFQRGHRRGMSDPGIDLNDVALELTGSAGEDTSTGAPPHHHHNQPRLITSHLSLDHLAQQELGRLSLSFDISLGVDGDPMRRVSGASSEGEGVDGGGGNRVSEGSTRSYAGENKPPVFSSAPALEQGSGDCGDESLAQKAAASTQLGPATDHHVLPSLSPFADRRLSPIGGSQRSHGCQRPSSTGDDVITALPPPSTTGLVEMGWHHSIGTNFDTSAAAAAATTTASSSSSPARSCRGGHLRSQSLGVLSLPHDVSDSTAFSFPLHVPDLGAVGSHSAHHPLLDPRIGGPTGSSSSAVNRFSLHQRHASEASTSLAARPPLYKTLSSSSGFSVSAATPAPPAGSGIWAMTESDRKRSSSSGSWDEGCAAVAGSSSSPDQSPDLSLLSDKPRFSDGTLESAAIAPQSSLVPAEGAGGSLTTTTTTSVAPFPLAPLAETTATTSVDLVTTPPSATSNNQQVGSSDQRGTSTPATYVCSLCGVSATSAAHLEAHFQGKRHQRTLASVYPCEGGYGQGASSTARFYCAICNVSATSEGHLESHFRGRQHARKAAALASGSPVGGAASTQLYHCALCGVTATSSEHLLAHFRGKQHARKSRLAAQGGDLLHSPPPQLPITHHHHHQEQQHHHHYPYLPSPFAYHPMPSPEMGVESAWMMPAGGGYMPAHPMAPAWWSPEMSPAGYAPGGLPPPPEAAQWMMPMPMMHPGWHS